MVNNTTKWVPAAGKAIICLTALVYSAIFLPTHVTAVRTQGLKENIPIVQLNLAHLLLIEKDPKKES